MINTSISVLQHAVVSTGGIHKDNRNFEYIYIWMMSFIYLSLSLLYADSC